jgi:ubiquinone/menaquinone biosynthesis C-methylase UbiE
MQKRLISKIFRRLGLLYQVDRLHFYVERFKNRPVNRKFRSDNPDIRLPPDYLIYESFQINYHKYYTESHNTAAWLSSLFLKYVKPQGYNILDWGCGPGRIIRHLPAIMGGNCAYYGTDYNAKSIAWCSKNLPGINFNNNSLEPVLPYADNFFDIIYGISIFTHLSEEMHYGWYSELHRILKPHGIFLFTTQGDTFRVKLSSAELIRYNAGMPVIRGHVREGHRTFSAFQPPAFVNQLVKNSEILEHIETRPEKGRWLPQDVWIIRKR